MADIQGIVDGSTGAEELVPRTADQRRSALDSRRAAAGNHPSYWSWLLSGGQDWKSSAAANGNGSLNGSAARDGQVNGNGSLNGHANGNGLNGHANGNGLNGHANGNGLNGHANGNGLNGHANGNGSLNGHGPLNGREPAMRRTVEEMALEGMTPTGLARRLGRC